MDEKENSLVEMVLAGNPGAFETLVTPYRQTLLSLAFRLTGNEGSQVFTFTGGMNINDVVKAINAQSDATGITATTSTVGPLTHLTFDSADYGTNAQVAIKVISGGATFSANMKDRTGNVAMYTAGTDIYAKVNLLKPAWAIIP